MNVAVKMPLYIAQGQSAQTTISQLFVLNNCITLTRCNRRNDPTIDPAVLIIINLVDGELLC